MRKHLGVMAMAVCALGSVSAAIAASTPPRDAAAGRPALWRTYDMIVNLQKLPRTYTCNQLWYEFHDILLRLGAWPYSVNILPYHCSPTPSGYMRSPDVEVRFQLPIFLQGAVKSAPAEAIERTIRLAPGQPKTLQTSDCQLLQQIEQGMLTSLEGARVDEDHFECAAPAPRAANFHVTLSLPMVVKMPPAPTTSEPAPH
ncbi:MAG: hypothetical protein WAU49_13195 [Steroidobacteraceae bacterium]